MTRWSSLGPDWANVSNTPFRYFKNYSYEGGINTPLIAYWDGQIEPGSFSRFPGHFIDIMAPGDNVFTTKNNGGYEITTGSSFAAPLVAGAAALVRSHFPKLNAQQVMEQLRATSDNIYEVGSNMNYFGQLGRGRLNVNRALSDIQTPSIRLSEYQYSSNHGELIFPGDTVSISMKFTNYLRTAENVTVTISNPTSTH